MRSWVLYSLVRLGLFAVVFVLLHLLLGAEWWWLSAICAALIALALSYIFLGRLRASVAADLATRRDRRHKPTMADEDASAEDSQVDGAETHGSEVDGDAR